jgi:hypothetical protein
MLSPIEGPVSPRQTICGLSEQLEDLRVVRSAA